MGDIDRFKAVNDDHGHEVGDNVLMEVVRVMEAEIREHDLCGRWGGEEFLLLMPETSTESAVRVMERLREAVAKLRVRINDDSLSVTVSLGMAQLRPDENYSSAINRADVALLRAKRNGRDRYELAD
jgi:diguanylate cyclase (GGDEF)-like protein